jgi:phycocyanobilin:ferredoxin oxidoreductase
MSYKETLDKMAIGFANMMDTFADGAKIDTEDFGWTNNRYVSDLFRVAHIERYSDKNLEVLHVTCFPTNNSSKPIYGFDIITIEKKCLAAFLDWSPVIHGNPTYKCGTQFNTPYKLPEWTNSIFSKDAVAVVPSDEEFKKVCAEAMLSFLTYMALLMMEETIVVDQETIIKGQNHYCEQQQKNERTFNVLKAKLGEDRARYFMETILFPKMKDLC